MHEFGIVSGLCLTEEEAKMFEPKLIVPYVAIGDKKPTTVIFYQFILSDCPHLNEKNECKIYEKRPLICKVFPINPNLNRVILVPKCPQIGKFGGKAGEMCPVIIDDAVIEKASKEISIIFLSVQKECKEKGLKIWFFDLSTRKWVVSKNKSF